MKKISLPILALGLGLTLLAACKSTKTPQGQTAQQTETTSKCNQPIKYYSEKARTTNGQELSFNTEVTINPLNKIIYWVSEPPGQGKVVFSFVIENIDCEFNADHTIGRALYHGYINYPDATTQKTILKLEANDGVLTFSSADTESEIIVIVSKWEVVKE